MNYCVKSVQIRIFFWSVTSPIRTEYGKIRSISPYSVWIREYTIYNEIIPLPGFYTMRVPWNNFANESQIFSWIDYYHLCGSAMKNCVFTFEKDLPKTLLFKKMKIPKTFVPAEFIDFLWSFARMFSIAMHTKK